MKFELHWNQLYCDNCKQFPPQVVLSYDAPYLRVRCSECILAKMVESVATNPELAIDISFIIFMKYNPESGTYNPEPAPYRHRYQAHEWEAQYDATTGSYASTTATNTSGDSL